MKKLTFSIYFLCFDDAKVRRKAEMGKSVQRIAPFFQ